MRVNMKVNRVNKAEPIDEAREAVKRGGGSRTTRARTIGQTGQEHRVSEP
jgi:hypothetical protein